MSPTVRIPGKALAGVLTAALAAAGPAGAASQTVATTETVKTATSTQHKKQGHDKRRHEAGCLAGTLGGAVLGGVLGGTMGKGGGKTAMTLGLAGLGGVGNSLACK